MNESLESAIINEAEEAIRSMALKEAEEIRRLDEAYESEIKAFMDNARSQTDVRIAQETSRSENRAVLELKKLKLKGMETFINATVGEAIKSIRINPRYASFIVESVADAVSLTAGGVEIRMMREDLNLEKEIRLALKSVDGNKNVTVLEDNRITWGGCIIEDRPEGRIFDCTIERAFFRKTHVIRREVMNLLREMSGGGF
jgi:flagellar biosynthesis/type III secretory pathway protein FliH